ncbi:Hypothetical predicted protein, partial [Olea europaea subsp. europaea]
ASTPLDSASTHPSETSTKAPSNIKKHISPSNALALKLMSPPARPTKASKLDHSISQWTFTRFNQESQIGTISFIVEPPSGTLGHSNNFPRS